MTVSVTWRQDLTPVLPQHGARVHSDVGVHD